MSLRFKVPKERIPLKGSKKQGLRGNKVKVLGNKKKKKKVSAPLQFLKPGKKSTYPTLGGGDEDVFARLARAESGSEEDGGGFSSSSDDGGAEGSSSGEEEEAPRAGGRRLQVSTPLRRSFPRASGAQAAFPRGGAPSLSSGSYSGSDSDDGGGGSMSDSDEDSLPMARGGARKKQQQQQGGDNPFGLDDSAMEEAEKQDILGRLHALRQRGVRLSKNYTGRSSLQELRMEMGRIEHEEETRRAILRLRRWLMAGVSGMQWVTSQKFTPRFARGRLTGFSDYVLGSIDDYDPVFERMSERYGGVIGIGSSGNPMLDLFILLGTQMVMFVFLQHQSSAKPPTPEDIKKQHPDMVRKAARELADQMREEDRLRDMEQLRQRQEQQEAYLRDFGRPLGHGRADLQWATGDRFLPPSALSADRRFPSAVGASRRDFSAFGASRRDFSAFGASLRDPSASGASQRSLGTGMASPQARVSGGGAAPMSGPSLDFSGLMGDDAGAEDRVVRANEQPDVASSLGAASSLVLNDEDAAPVYDVARDAGRGQTLEDFYRQGTMAAPESAVEAAMRGVISDQPDVTELAERERAARVGSLPLTEPGMLAADLGLGAPASGLGGATPAFMGVDTYPSAPMESMKSVEMPVVSSRRPSGAQASKKRAGSSEPQEDAASVKKTSSNGKRVLEIS